MKKMKITLILALILSLGACAKEDKLNKYSKTELNCGFDTVCSLLAYTKTEQEFMSYFDLMIENFNFYHKLFDIYHTYEGINNLKTINDNAGKGKVKVVQEIIDLLNLAKEVSEVSDNAFNITNGALLKVWHEYRDEGKLLNSEGEYGYLPNEDELIEASKHKGFDKIIIDDENNTVEIVDENVSLDVGAIAKGYATEIIANKLEEKGLKHAAINAGGNNRLINDKADGTGFNVAIQDPRASSLLGQVTNSNIAVIPNVINKSIVTSGDYQNYYYTEGDIRQAHIIDPNTLHPATHYNSVTIITENSGLADCLSTALYVLDYEDGLKTINKVNEHFNTDLIVIWITNEPLDETSVKSISETTQYITVTSNYKDLKTE